MSKFSRAILLVFLTLFLVATSIISLNDPNVGKGASEKTIQKKLNQESPNGVVVASSGNVSKVITDINNLPLQDNLDLYQDDDPGSVVTMYVTVRRGNDLNKTNHTWKEVNDISKFFRVNTQQVSVPMAEAILQVGDENGPLPGEFGFDDKVSNATIHIRGNSTSISPQKSYKITIFDGSGEWRGQKIINLNKSVFEITRNKNKLAFDLIKGIPNMVSLRTQFVHLYVKDETAVPARQAFEDYGLFTQIEQPNKKFLKNHLLDRYGQLYKANMFEFYRYPEQIRMSNDPLYNETEFSKLLEIKGNKDHTKLIEMLDDVNNYSIPINEVMGKYFDEENYFTWMAFNILVENVDTSSQNFYLYSPQNGLKWYFLPWDYDGGFNRQEPIGVVISPYERGISNYWGVVLHRRVLSVPEYRRKLDDKINELIKYLTPERLNDMLNVYRPITDQYVSKMPDLYHLPATLEEYDRQYSLIPIEPQVNYDLYQENLKSPMPFYLGTPQKDNGQITFSWNEAYDFGAQDITYHFEISTNWDFKSTLIERDLTNTNHFEIQKLEPGTYFWRVVATNENGKSQFPFDYYIDSNEDFHYGLKYLYISSDGEILEKVTE